MKERIARLLREEGLTPGKLAEKLGVQPSSISHLLSGRNKPSFDFIGRILSNYPDINPYWLILGQEPIHNESINGRHGEESDDTTNVTNVNSAPVSDVQLPRQDNKIARSIEKVLLLRENGTFAVYESEE